MEPVQKFDYRSSPYHRPNQDWVCGRSAEGKSCSLGPDERGRCGAGPQCSPRQDGARWHCTRSELGGGRCETGPLPDGTCACITPPCRPRRSVKAWRRLVTRSTLAVTLGLLLLGLAPDRVEHVVNPGKLTLAHAAIGDCTQCHDTPHHEPSRWLAAAFGGDATSHDSQACLTCHEVGAASLAPHGLASEELPQASVAPRGDGPWTVEVAHRVFEPASGDVQCTSCHVEHDGPRANLRAVSDDRCQVCHSVRFTSLADGHPAFDAYPYQRRTRINFDHAAHIGKHFEKEKDAAPESCGSCHIPAANGQAMLVRSFETTCASCHGADVDGEKLAGAKGTAIIEVPGIDVATLADRGIAIGGWPEFAEARLSPLGDLLLAKDSAYLAAREKLGELDLLDLESASDADLDAVAALAWSFKRLVSDIGRGGAAALLARLDASLAPEQVLTKDEQRALAGRLPATLIDSATARWFPDLDAELAALASGSAPPASAVRAKAAPSASAAPAPAPAADDAEGFDDLFGGGLFGDDGGEAEAETAPPAAAPAVDEEAFDDLFGNDLLADDGATESAAAAVEEAPAAETPAAPLSVEERMSLGGWYLDDFVLRYRPAGHADPFSRAWLDLAAAHPSIDGWLDKENPGACTKCHGISVVDGVQQIDWQPRRPLDGHHPFTVFSHLKHFSMAGDEGCRTCHVAADEADYEAAFEQTDPMVFESNFAPMSRDTCATCHTDRQAGADCVLCHRYHVGTLTVTLPTAPMTSAAKESGDGE